MQTKTQSSAEGSESSVVFNLAELMRMEHERVNAEQAAARAAEASAAAARAEQARQAELRAARLQLTAAQHAQAERELISRLEAERAVALLRVQLEVEAGERTERERLALRHEADLRALALLHVRGTRLRRLAAFGASVLLTALVGLGLRAERMLQLSAASSTAAQALAVRDSHELAALRRQLVTRRASTSTPSAQGPDARATPSSPKLRTPPLPPLPLQVHTQRHLVQARGGERSTASVVDLSDPLDVLDDASSDPLLGLGELRKAGHANSAKPR